MATAFKLVFQGSQQATPVSIKASGVGTVVFDGTSASYQFTISGLDFGTVLGLGAQTAKTTDDVTLMHVHNAARGVDGGVVLDLLPSADDDDFDASLNSPTSATFSGNWEPGDTDPMTFAALLAAATPGSDVDLYFNIHTSAFPGGAIRAQWVCIADDNANIVNGTNGADFLPGLAGNDKIDGKKGNDTLDGGDGNDILIGGKGVDTITYAAAAAGVTVNLALTTQQNTSGAGLDTIKQVENIIGSAHNDTLTGNKFNNLFIGGAGEDSFDGGKGFDTVSYATSEFGVHAGINSLFGTGGDAQGDSNVRIEKLIGSDHDDELDGTTGANTLFGGAGNDFLLSYGGRDLLDGGANDDEIVGDVGNQRMFGRDGNDSFDPRSGKDIVDGGAGIDGVLYEHSAAGVTVNLSLRGAQKGKGDAKGDKLISIENLIGSTHNDTLTGSKFANEITGGEGRDIPKGGGGGDTFIFTSISDSPAFNPNRDIVRDFAVGVDKIDLIAIAGITNVAGLVDSGDPAALGTSAGLSKMRLAPRTIRQSSRPSPPA